MDLTGRRTQITEQDGRTSTYTYDDLYRLTAEDIIDPVNGNHNASWTYDAVGNRLSDTTNGVTTSYSYDANDRLLTQGNQSFTYDDRGSTLSESDGVSSDTFVYDSRNKLVEAMVEGSLLTMSYDMDGNRVGKTVNNVPVNYVVDNNQAYAQVVVEEQITGTLDYTFGTDLLGLDSVSGDYTYHTDALGSNRLVTDSAGSSADELGYDAWGEVLAGGDLAENQYRYTGEQFDSDLDKVYLRARYLDTDRGGFTQMDVFEGLKSQTETLHKYAYVGSEPSNYLDPTGYLQLNDLNKALSIQSNLAITPNPIYYGILAKATVTTVVAAGTISVSADIATKRILEKCIKTDATSKKKCNPRNNIFIVGDDRDEMRDHILYAQSTLGSPSKVTRGAKRHPSGWIKKRIASGQACQGGPGTQCDEYPMAIHVEGGENGITSLRSVNAFQNQSIGGMVARFHERCGIDIGERYIMKSIPGVPLSGGICKK